MCKILNYGSLNIDRVYTVKEFVAPGETIASIKYEVFPGGKGLNQSIAAAKAGGEVYHAGCIGGDGTFLSELLRENGVNTDFLSKIDEATGHAIIQVNESGQNCIILYGGSNQSIPRQICDTALTNFSQGDILILQNEVNGNREMLENAHAIGMRIALNPSPFNEKISLLPLDKVTWLLINEVEGEAITGHKSPHEICTTLLQKYPNMKIVLTLGSKGVLYFDSDTSIERSAYAVSAVDTTAAGDTFTGYFLSSLAQNKSLEEAIGLATAAASIAVSRKGASVSIPSIEEVLKYTIG